MSDTSPKAPSPIDDLNPKEIFAEINSEIGADKKSYTPRQKTRLNYTYVILLNIILLIAVSIGVYTVYGIFREQGVRLTAGTGGIQSLEVLLLEQESRRQAQEIAAKEEQLRQAQQNLAEIEGQLSLIRSDIQGQVSSELERQRLALEERIQQELQGKSAAEQQAIRNQYQQELQRLQTDAQQEIDRRVAEAENTRRMELEQRQAEQLRLQQDITNLSERLRVQEQTVATQVQPTPIIQDTYDDNGVSLLFNSIEAQLRQGNYREVERLLERIEVIYRQPAPEVKRTADLFLVSLIRDYISVSNNNSNLLSQLVVATNVSASNQNAEMARFRIVVEEISRLVEENPQNPAIANRLRTLQQQTPDAFVFYNAYRTYQAQEDARRATPLIRQAERAYGQRNYTQAVSIYQNVLRSYPNVPNQQNVLNSLYQALQAQSSSGQSMPYSGTAESSVVYMKAPDGYIYDMGGGRVVISLLPGIAMKPRTAIRIFRVNPSNGLELSLIGEGSVIEGKGQYVSANISNTLVKLGDLVYISK
ncbi:MAG: hypothetical protein ACRCY4_01510 [Brevinema sp.]